jgi:serine/threonine protein kinase
MSISVKQNYIGSLNELLQQNGRSPPTYSFAQVGADHSPTFACTVNCNLTGYELVATGTATIKQDAKRNAAELLLRQIDGAANSSSSQTPNVERLGAMLSSLSSMSSEFVQTATTAVPTECYEISSSPDTGEADDEFDFKFTLRLSLSPEKYISMGRSHVVSAQLDTILGQEEVIVKLWMLPDSGIKSNTNVSAIESLKREVKSLRSLSERCEHVVSVKSFFCLRYPKLGYGHQYSCIIMERFGQSLECYMGNSQNTGLLSSSPDIARGIIRQLLVAYAACHSSLPVIAHRDVKPANVLIEPKRTSSFNSCAVPSLKLCDFEQSRHFNLSGTVASTFVAPVQSETEYWTAPEMTTYVNERSYNHTVDLWGIGHLIFFVTGQCALFKSRSETLDESAFPRLLAARSRAPSSALRFSLMCDLILRFLKGIPSERICAQHALLHPAIWSGERICTFICKLQDLKCDHSSPRIDSVFRELDCRCDIFSGDGWLVSLPIDWQNRLKAFWIRQKVNFVDPVFASRLQKPSQLVRHLRNLFTHETNSYDECANVVVDCFPRLIPVLFDAVQASFGQDSITFNSDGIVFHFN